MPSSSRPDQTGPRLVRQTQFTLGGINHLWARRLDVLIAAGQRTAAVDSREPDDAEPSDAPDAGEPA